MSGVQECLEALVMKSHAYSVILLDCRTVESIYIHMRLKNAPEKLWSISFKMHLHNS